MTVMDMPLAELLASPLALLLGLAVFLLVVGMPPLWLYLQHRRRGRELLHLERMQAIQAGVAIEPPRSNEVKERQRGRVFWIAFWLGGALPLGSVAAAGSVSGQAGHNLGLSLVAWITAMVLGIVGVVAATVLMVPGGGRRQWGRHAARAKAAKTEKLRETLQEKLEKPARPQAAQKPPHREPPRDLGFAAWLESLAHRMQAR